MALNGVLRTALVQIRVLDMDKALTHYIDRIGLKEVCRTSDGRVCLKAYDEFDHHSVVLRKADTAGMDFIGMKVLDEETLVRLEKDTKEFGLECEDIPANSDQPGFGRRVRVSLPSGHKLDLFAEAELSDNGPAVHNPEIWEAEPSGMAPTCFDHALLYGTNLKETTRYFTEVLEMRIAERLVKEDGDNLCVWLTASTRPHDLAILDYPEPGKLHHISFHLQDWQAIGHAADIMARYDISIDVGPTRHGITRGQTIYFFDPSGNRDEVYAGGYEYFPDHPTRYWDASEVGKGIFYYERKLNEAFLGVVS